MNGRRGRRWFLVGGGALLVALPVVQGQPTAKPPRIGFVSPISGGRRDDAFRRGLGELGYSEGRDLEIVMRFAEGRPERLPGLIEEVIRLKVDVLVVGSTIGARAAKSATTTLPIVFAGSSDPVAGGIVTNLARPEGNVTGTSLAIGEGFAGKWFEVLKEVVPGVSHVAALWSSSNAAAAGFVKELQAASRKSNARLDVHHASNSRQLDEAFAAIGSSNARGLIVTPSPFAASSQEHLVRFAASRKVPAIYFTEDFADAGGLMSYGPSIADAYRRAAAYVDKILRGARPGDLPVEQATRFELIVNLKTVRALALPIPRSVLVRADRVIE